MKEYLGKISFLVVFRLFITDIYAQVPPAGCLDDLKEIYQELQREENKTKNLLDILKSRMEKTIYGYSKAYLNEPGTSINPRVEEYLNKKIEKNTQQGFEAALNNSFGRLEVDTSSFPQSTQSILDNNFNSVDKFIIKAILEQSPCEGNNLCGNEEVLEGFHGMLMNINNDPVNSAEAKKILEDEYAKLSERFAEVLALKLREYVAKQQENEQCKDFLASVPASMLDLVDPLLLLGCEENSNQKPIGEDSMAFAEDFVESQSQSACPGFFMTSFSFLSCLPSSETASSADTSTATPGSDDGWSLSIEKEGGPDKKEVKLNAIVKKPSKIKLADSANEQQSSWGTFSWKCDDQDCGDGKKEITIERKNKSMEVEVTFVPKESAFQGSGILGKIFTQTEIEAYCENYSSLGCQDDADEEEKEQDEKIEAGNLFDYLDTCYLNLSPGFCNQMVPPQRGVGLPRPDPINWTFGHN